MRTSAASAANGCVDDGSAVDAVAGPAAGPCVSRRAQASSDSAQTCRRDPDQLA
ncbi:MAG: hypothetical protein ACKVU4_11880 [Phycisphaerales bacterium]